MEVNITQLTVKYKVKEYKTLIKSHSGYTFQKTQAQDIEVNKQNRKTAIKSVLQVNPYYST